MPSAAVGVRVCVATTLAVFALSASRTVAADRYWDGGSVDIAVNGNSASAGGVGTWNTALLNWDEGASPHVAWVNTNNDVSIFSGTAGTVTLGTAVTAGGLQFNVTGYTISGSTLTLATGATVSVAGDATISSILAGSSGFTKTGFGRLALTAANTYSGTTTVSAGFIDFTNISPASFGGGSGRNISIVAGGGVRRNTIDNAFLNRLVETTGEITVMTGTTANNFDFSSSTGANLPNAFLGNWASNGAKMEYSGQLTPASDAYRLGGKGSSGLLGIVGTNQLTGTRGLIVGNTGASGIRVMLAGANDFTGETVINTGAKLVLGNNLALQNSSLNVGGSGGNFALNSLGTVTGAAASASPTFGGLIGTRDLLSVFSNSGGNNESNLASTAVTGFTLNPGTGKTCTYPGVIANFAPGTKLTKTGTGTQIFTGANTYTGTTTINGGTLQIGDGGIAGSLATSAVTNNATLIYNRSNDLSVGYAISGSGQLIKQGAGILTLTVAPAHSGDTTISTGTLKLNFPNSNNEPSTVTIAASGASLQLNFSGTDTVAKLFIDTTPMANGVYKAVGNPVPGIELAQITGTGTLTVTGDLTPPTLVSFVDDKNGRPVAANSTVTYTLTFNEDMDSGTVSAADFSNVGTAPISIGTITETAPGVFTVLVTPTAAGTLQLQIPGGATLSDVTGNALVTTPAIVDNASLVVYKPDSITPALRGISPVANSSGSAITLAMPTGVKPGDLLIANIAQFGTTSGNPTATGWTRIDGRMLGNNTSYYGAVFYKVATVTETVPYAFTLSGGSPVASGVVLAVSDVDTIGGPFDATNGTIYSATSSTTSVGPATQRTTVSPDAAVLMLGMAVGTSSVTWSGWSTTLPGSLTELYDVTGSGTGNNATSLGAAWASKTATGATGTGGATLFASARNGSILLALKPSYSSSLMSALAALKAHVTGDALLTNSQIAAHKVTIEAQQSRFGSSASVIAAALDLIQTYDEVLGPLWVARTLPDRAVVTDDIHYTIYTVMQNIIDWTYTSTNLANQAGLLNSFAFGSSSNFPGACTPPADPNQTHTAVINGNYLNTWGRPTFHEDTAHPAPKPTGTYLAPGSIATVTVPAFIVGKGYRIRVGAHSWDYTGKPFIKRLDRCSLVYNIVSTDTQVANPLGGGIYIEVPQYVSNVGIVSVQIKNAVRSPYFSAKSFHRTTLSEWQNTERLRQAPWADFQSEKVMMQVPTSWIYALNDPVKLMADWDLSADITNDLMGFPRNRGRETIYNQVDLLIRAGAYAPGYPAVNNTYTPGSNSNGYSNSYLVRGPQFAPDFEFHESGHGYLFPKFPGEVESVVNLLHVPVWNRGFGYSLNESYRESRSGYPDYATLDTTAIAWMMCDNFLNGIAMEGVEKQYQLKGHAKFVDIARMFGWEKLNDHYYSFNVDYENNVTIPTDVDSLLLRLSRNVGVDIRPLFHLWGVPPINNTTLGAAIAAANLPASVAIHNTLVKYKSLIPANNAAFRTFASSWWGRQPLLTGYTEENNHARRWDTYDAASAAATGNRAQQIINLYFPNGMPSDYGDWTTQWTGANLVNPNADLDGDGMSNDHERIWGLNPTNASSRNPINFNTSLKSDSFTYTRRDPALTGLIYTIWTSANLKDWTQDSGAVQTPGAPNSNNVQTVVVTLSPSLLTAPKLFLQTRAAN